MRDMKDSGIEWVGTMPTHWTIERMKLCIKQRDGGAWGSEETGEDDTICLRIADFDYSRFVFKDSDLSDLTKRHYSKNTLDKLLLEEGDILIEKSGGGEKTPVGRTVVFDKNYSALFANFMDRIKCQDFIYPKFMQYVFVTFYKNQYTRNYINQTTGIQNLDLTTMLAKEHVPVPDLDEQHRIADFLDAKCAQINLLIDEVQEQISLLDKHKDSIITKAVTKGLKSEVSFVDSGISWIGIIPSHWRIVPYKYILNERNEKNSPVKSEERLSLSIGLGVTLYSEKTTNLDRYKDDVSQYKLAHKGDLVMNSMNMIVGAVGITDYYGCVSPAYYTFYDNEEDHVTAKYCEYIFLSSSMRSILYSLGKGIMAIDRGDGRVNTCRLKVSKYDLSHLRLPLPPIDEQRDIVSYLNNVSIKTSEIMRQKMKQIDTLDNYKKSLIYEYVTGKKEVTA